MAQALQWKAEHTTGKDIFSFQGNPDVHHSLLFQF
jgi:hypothetical protein